MSSPLSFAIVGHPNEGKSSIVATLAMNDRIRISSTPGETTQLQRFDLMAGNESVIEFVDTPGFQNPQATLAWFQENEHFGAELAHRFIEDHSSNEDFHHDCELLSPISKGAGIIYIVDGSRPMTGIDAAEMEIFRLSARPRMAIINSKTNEKRFLDSWKNAFRQSFNSIRTFNAQTAGYLDRIELLEALKSIDQDWVPQLTRAVELVKLDRERSIERTAEAIIDHLTIALSCQCSKLLSQDSGVELEKRKLEEEYRLKISRAEARFRGEVNELFQLNRVKIDLSEQTIINEDLFSDKTWQVLGLTSKQLAIAGALLGAGIGAGADIVAAGLTFGIFTSIGAAVGAGSALWKGKELARAKIKRLPIGGLKISVGPNQSPQFPFILIDRDLLFARYASNWAHARRDTAYRIDSESEKSGPASEWTQSELKVATRFIQSLSKPTSAAANEARAAFKKLLKTSLEKS